MICRPATPADIAWLTGTSLDAYRIVFQPLLPGHDWSGFSAAFFKARFAQEWRKVRIAALNDRPLGFSLVAGVRIDMLFVAEGMRGAGVGKAILDDAEARGAKELECFAVNMAARRFYERNGWTVSEVYTRAFAGLDCAFVCYVKR